MTLQRAAKCGLALAVCVLLLASSTTVLAQTFNSYQLNGDATLQDGGNTLRLTLAANSQSGSGINPFQFALAGDTTINATYQFRIHDSGNGGADGIQFIIHSDTDGIFALGAGGGSMGYGGISPSVGFEADTWDNGGGDSNSANHIGINLNGSLSSVAINTTVPNLESGQPLFAWVDYDAQTAILEYSVSDVNIKPANPMTTLTIDLEGALGQCVWVGFTAGTGGANAAHDIEDFAIDWNGTGNEECGGDEPRGPSIPIPTLSAWALGVMVLLIAGTAAFRRFS